VMRSFLARYSSESDVRAVMDGKVGYDVTAWRMAAEQIGVQALVIPEEMAERIRIRRTRGGDEEAGRSLFPAPLLSTTVLATSALVGSAGRSPEYLARIATGELVATVAVSEALLHGTPRTSRRRRRSLGATGGCPDPSLTCWTRSGRADHRRRAHWQRCLVVRRRVRRRRHGG